MKIASLFLIGSFFNLSLVFGQTSLQEIIETPEKTGGVLYAYPSTGGIQTPPPEGYEPFYISHFGRHGSRYLISDSEYKWPLDLFADASEKNALTPLGKEVYNRLVKVWEEAEGHGGDLSPLGIRQQRAIAERMYQSFPEVFENNLKISARSTTVIRCVLSMDAFCERLKELNTTLDITREASNKYMPYLNHHTEEAKTFRAEKDTWKKDYNRFEEEHVNPERLIQSLFSDQTYIQEQVKADKLMWALFQIAGDMQNMETNLSFYDIFEREELVDLWQCGNYYNYVSDGPSAINGGIMLHNGKLLLKNIMESADKVITASGKGADFRFGHDGNLIPFAALLHLKDCYESISEPANFYKVWSNFKVAPMGANIQMIFYRKKGSDDILVKFLHNEQETIIPPVQSNIVPYYNWNDLKNYYNSLDIIL